MAALRESAGKTGKTSTPAKAKPAKTAPARRKAS
jgi:hypothetical protein